MAISGVIFNPSFASFLSSGNGFHRRSGVASLHKENFGLSIGLWGQTMLNGTSQRLTQNCLTFKLSHSSLLCFTNAEDWRSSTHFRVVYDDWGHSFSHFQQTSDHSFRPGSLKRVKGISRCSVYPNSCCRRSTSVPSLTVDRFLVDNSKYLLSNHANTQGILSHYKSDEFDITEAGLESLGSPEGLSEVVLRENNAQKATSLIEELPKRWVIVLLCFAAFLLCNMDCVNMSIAILPMSKEFNWSSSTVGLIQSSFFWGYLLTQIAGGIWADKVDGKLVLAFGVIWWSVATVLTPLAARGVAMPAMNNMISKWIRVSERSRALSLVYSGMYLGSVVGLAFSPVLIHKFGWPSVFYSFGSLGRIWIALWLAKVLKFNLMESGLFCVLPWLTMAIFANIGGWIAGTLISRGLSVTSVLKIMQTVGFLGPAFSLSILSKVRTPALAVICMACSQGSDAFSQSGLYSNHQDIGPRYSGVLLGLSNTAGVLAGVFGTAATRFILQRGSWDDVFKVAIALYIIGTIVWITFATGEKILD